MDILGAVITFILGGGFLSFLQFLIERRDKRKDDIKEFKKQLSDVEKRLSDKIDAIEAKADERNAVNARVRILRFADETMDGRKHSKDSYDQVMHDIDDYEEYCEIHPDFKNNQTIQTVGYLKKIYAERLEKHDFL